MYFGGFMSTTTNGIKAYRSMLGHNNFYYPNIDAIVFLKPGSKYKRMAWVGSNMEAINVNAQDIIDETGNNEVVIWVEPDKLKTI
jgi:hypothetical protein